MGAFDDFLTEIKKTETMQALLESLEKGSAELLKSICQEYEATSKPVPDHHLNLTGYFREALLRVLLSANMITKEKSDRLSLYCYKPTETGLNYYKSMLAEKKI